MKSTDYGAVSIGRAWKQKYYEWVSVKLRNSMNSPRSYKDHNTEPHRHSQIIYFSLNNYFYYFNKLYENVLNLSNYIHLLMLSCFV